MVAESSTFNGLDPRVGQEDSFEGTEKLLEVWLTCSRPEEEPETDETCWGMRRIEREHWVEVLELVQCQILNVISNEYLDAYLLSESSLFVFPDKIILKTCGTTTLLLALPAILDLAVRSAGAFRIEKIFYSRKCFTFPEKQQWPHQSWDEEVCVLDRIFDTGSAYVLGRLNAEHWYLYIGGPQNILPEHIKLNLGNLAKSNATLPVHRTAVTRQIQGWSPSPQPPLEVSKILPPFREEDQTLEIIMTNLDKAKCKQFWFDVYGQRGATDVEKKCGLSDVLNPVSRQIEVDSFLFKPCGYSVNSLPTSLGPYYSTVHVTPEENCSYASFETNVPIWKSHLGRGLHEEGNCTPEVLYRALVDAALRDQSSIAKRSTSLSTTSLNAHFETPLGRVRDALAASYRSLVAQVVDVFDPDQFSVTLFRSRHPKDICALKTSNWIRIDEILDTPHSNGKSSAVENEGEAPRTSRGTSRRGSHRNASNKPTSAFSGYVQTDKVVHEFEDYELIFYRFLKGIGYS